MKKLFPGIILFLLLGYAGEQHNHESAGQNRKKILRQQLLHILELLDLEKILSGNRGYLACLNAGFDEDNRCFYLEKPATAADRYEHYLVTIDVSKKDSIVVRIFSPDRLADLWLSSRIRIKSGYIHVSTVFHPLFEPEDHIRQKFPIKKNSRISFLY
jgi:hypothetical protein